MRDETLDRDGSGRPPPAPDELYTFVDLRDRTGLDAEDADDADDPGAARPRASRSASPSRARAARPSTRPATRPAKAARRRGRGAELNVGLLIGGVLATLGTIALATDTLHWPATAAMFAGGGVAGMFTVWLFGPVVNAVREVLAGWLAPSRRGGA